MGQGSGSTLSPAGSHRMGTAPLFKNKKTKLGGEILTMGLLGGLGVRRALQELLGRRGDPAVRVSRDMVPPRGTRL